MKEDVYIGSGRDGFTEDPENSETPKNQEVNKTKFGIQWVLLGFLVALVAFFIGGLILSTFDLHYAIKAITVLVFAALVVKAYDKVTGGAPNQKTAAVSNFMLIMFILCLFTGYQNDHGKSAGKFFDAIFFATINENPTVKGSKRNFNFTSESGTVSKGEVWFPSKVFKKGDKIEIKVEFNSVQMVEGRVLTPGVYKNEVFEEDGEGQIVFEGIENNPSTITVIY